MSDVLTSVSGQVLTVTLNRPERLNAVSADLYAGLISALERANNDDDIRVVIVTGEGRAFCVGADLKDHEAGERTEQQKWDYVQLGQAACRSIQEATVPVIAAVRGFALGAGAELATSADFLIMADDAQMAFPEVSLGTFVGGGVTHRLPRLIGLRRATDILMLGERFTGRQAADWGLVSASAPGDVIEESLKLASVLARKSPMAFARMKAALFRNPTITEAFESEAADLFELMKTTDWAEGINAFAERRDPVFIGE